MLSYSHLVRIPLEWPAAPDGALQPAAWLQQAARRQHAWLPDGVARLASVIQLAASIAVTLVKEEQPQSSDDLAITSLPCQYIGK
jgi:hypothetical protein